MSHKLRNTRTKPTTATKGEVDKNIEKITNTINLAQDKSEEPEEARHMINIRNKLRKIHRATADLTVKIDINALNGEIASALNLIVLMYGTYSSKISQHLTKSERCF